MTPRAKQKTAATLPSPSDAFRTVAELLYRLYLHPLDREPIARALHVLHVTVHRRVAREKK